MSLENFPGFLLNFSEREMNGEAKHFYQFKSFRLDVAERQLLHNDKSVALTPKAFDVLAALVTRGGHLVEKDELLKLVWADSFVEEANVARIVHTLRRILGEDDNGNKFIETVAKKGYRFVAEVSVSEPPAVAGGLTSIDDYDKLMFQPEQLKPPATADGSDISQTPPVAKPKQTTRIVLLAVGFLSAAALIFLLSFNFQSASSVNPNEVKSIAVLPLKSLNAENRDAIYELGAADSLIHNLSSAKNLVVRHLGATQGYSEANKNPLAVGKEQKVDYVLASNYQITGGKIRITSQLINVSDGAIEEVFRDEQNISNIFAVQDAFAANVGRKILTKLNRESNNIAPKRYTISEEAYRLYLQGRVLTNRRSRKDAAKAIEYLEQAVKIDPNYALAYAVLANAYIAAGNFSDDASEQYAKAKAAIEKALAIDDNLAEAHAFAGEVKFISEWDFAGAEREFRRAVELDPNSAAAHQIYAIYLNSMGRFDEAIAENKIAIDLEPASVLSHRDYGMILCFARRYDEAIVQLERTIEMDANFRTAYGWLINAYKMKGENDKAFELFLRAPHRKDEPPEKLGLWKEIYAKAGWRGIHLRQVEEAKAKEKNIHIPYWELVNPYLDLGDKEQAIAHLEELFQKGERGWIWTTLKVNPKFDLIRSDPRFEAIVKRVGLK
jgi:DNA-binding winged helix-turn-helix (wHTH) protein/TolB-like protein/Tfp pilus assembly protein PilF